MLANQANFRPIDRNVLDRRIGIHRSTRARCMSELRELGFISGTESHITVNDPFPILQRLEESDRLSREQAKIDFGIDEPKDLKPVKQTAEKTDFFAVATSAWNKHRPNNYQKMRLLSSQLLKAIDLHIAALNLKRHDYDGFFSVLSAGVNRSKFWSEENSSKTLQSIVGVGSPQSQKYQNVQTLYNEGLEFGTSEPKEEADRNDIIMLPSSMRKVIDEYDELHHTYYKLSRQNFGNYEALTPRIIEVENKIREAGLDPAKFRMKYQLPSWPSSVPEPAKSRKTFWRYDDEL